MNKKSLSLNVRRALGIVAVLIAFVAGYRFHGGTREAPSSAPAATGAPEATVWTCSMDPQIRLPKPGKCPICFMDLVPLQSHADEAGESRGISVRPEAARRMELETAPVERRFVSVRIPMVGRVDFDETRLFYITARVPGRLDRLFVGATGKAVKKGDPLVSLYSPELVGAQEELFQAMKAVISRETDSAGATLAAVREKLRLWGVTPEQIAEIERRGVAEDHVTVYAPADGVVIHKDGQEGMYVATGTRIYTMADLSEVWIHLDAYESDLAGLRNGQRVTFTVESYPGESFAGTITLIQPVLNESTRTVQLRVTASNEDLRLKPGMFVRAVTFVEMASEGRVRDATMTEEDRPLVIPATAPLLTGKRAMVYVEVPGGNPPTYEGREVMLGSRAGDDYIVRKGLAEGDRVVVRGSFKLDAELQIQARPSMMSAPSEGRDTEGPAHSLTKSMNPEFQRQFSEVIQPCLKVSAALARDDAAAARTAAQSAMETLTRLDIKLVSEQDRTDWMKQAEDVKSRLTALVSAGEIEAIRERLEPLSEAVAATLVRFGVPAGPVYKAWCPMAFNNRGAIWIQSGEEIQNPYFGARMLTCGEIREVLK